MSMSLAVQVWRLQLDKTTAFVLMALCDSADDDGTGCLASEEYLCWKTGVSRASLYRVLGKLTQMGVLTRVTLADGRVETIIRLDAIPQKPEWSRPKRGRKLKSHHETHLSQIETHLSHHETHISNGQSHHETHLSQIETGRSNMIHPTYPSYINGGSGDARARDPLSEQIISAGELPAQTNRAALTRLIENHPDISEGEWVYEAAAAAEWFTEHERRLTLRSFGSWIERVQRRKRQLDTRDQQEQEATHEQPTEHGRIHGKRRGAPAATRTVGTIPHTPENDEWEPDDGTPWETEEERIRRYLTEQSTGATR